MAARLIIIIIIMIIIMIFTAFPTYRRLFVCSNKLDTLSTLKKQNKKKRIFYIYITSIYN